MARQTPFKEGVNPGTVRALGEALQSADPRFDLAAFTAAATDGLDRLALKARVAHVAAALGRHVDPDFPTAAARLVAALPERSDPDGLFPHGFTYWPACRWVEEAGLAHPAEALATMKVLTAWFSCEFAVRPYLVQDPEETLATLTAWTADPDQHVRRLVSEGTRPRLPWGLQLRRFMSDPSETLSLLERLVDDPERYVQRSVANHLNDISKDHPDRAVAVAGRWLEEPTPGRTWIVRHALRGLVKAGHPGALAVLGHGPPQLSCDAFEVQPHFRVGGKLALAATLTSTADRPQDLVVDVVIDFVKASGKRSPKVFKWTIRTLAAGGTLALVKGLPLRPVSTRRYYPGTHAVTLQINGQALATRDFELVLPD